MISIFFSHFYSPLEDRRFSSLLELMPEGIRHKALKYRKWEDVHAYLLGKCLLMHAVALQNNKVSIAYLRYSKFGRPYFAMLEDFDFNISHSGNLVVCAVTNRGRIGIDVEKRKHINISDFKEQFLATEWQHIKDEGFPHYTFYDYWTKKEAVIKADGRGMALSLNFIDVTGSSQVILDGHSWSFQKIDAFKDYACNLVYNDMQDGLSLHYVDFNTCPASKKTIVL